MQRYEKLSPCLYGAEIFYGKIDLKITHGFSCFFIVEHTTDKTYIKDQVMQLLLTGCRNFDFYGAAEPVWHLCVDEVNSILYPDPTPENVALTSGWNSIKDFVDALDEQLSSRPFVLHDFYLIYDDAGIYAEVLRMLDDRNKLSRSKNYVRWLDETGKGETGQL